MRPTRLTSNVNLVDSSAAGLNGGYPVRSIIVADLRALVDAANGAPVEVVSGFRSHSQQKTTFDYWVSVGGYEGALYVGRDLAAQIVGSGLTTREYLWQTTR